MKKSKAIFWDNDGVLVDSEELYYEASREVLEEIGVKITLAQFIRISLQQGESMLDLATAITAKERNELRRRRNQRYAEIIRDKITVRDGVEDCLRALHGTITMGIVTASLQEHFDLIHAKSGLLPYFDFIMTNEAFARSKPYPDPYLAALKHVKLSPENCVVVEDSERGLVSAKAAGLKCFVVLSELTKGGDFSKADRVFSQMSELQNALVQFRDA